jgi:accessory gene regulator protein AgrB
MLRLLRGGSEGNARLTAMAGLVLLALLAVEGVTILSIHQLLSVHVFVGLLLIPPVALKLASTGYRFLRFYGGNAAYVAKGPPHIAMRLLAPLLVVSTLTVLGTGVALLALGPEHHRDFVLGLHKASFLVWFVLMSVHVLVYAPRLPRAVLSSNAWARVGLVAASVAAGAVLAGAAYSLAAPWLHRANEHEREGAGAYFSVLR